MGERGSCCISGYNGGGRMSGVGGTGGTGSYKGYPEGGYASGVGGQFESTRGGNPSPFGFVSSGNRLCCYALKLKTFVYSGW